MVLACEKVGFATLGGARLDIDVGGLIQSVLLVSPFFLFRLLPQSVVLRGIELPAVNCDILRCKLKSSGCFATPLKVVVGTVRVDNALRKETLDAPMLGAARVDSRTLRDGG